MLDAPALFGPVIMSLSLLSDCIMKFTLQDQSIDVVLRKSILYNICCITY